SRERERRTGGRRRMRLAAWLAVGVRARWGRRCEGADCELSRRSCVLGLRRWRGRVRERRVWSGIGPRRASEKEEKSGRRVGTN
uniref:Uncharacterized protein n=1 Tax=Aegilops tauschii subsp. strangulata TaxID=200361 RepID=A0A453R7F5_AEGTS